MDTLLQKDCPIEGKWSCQPTNEKKIRIKAAHLMGAMDNEIKQAAYEFADFVMSYKNAEKPYDSGTPTEVK